MADDGEINIKTKIDTSGAETGAKNLSSKLGELVKKGGAFSGILTGVTAGLKASTKVIKETTNAINTQITAEKQLEAAARNNPYLDDQSVKQLKEYASQIQSISTIGDEQLMPLMAKLASSGRTQAEIQQIVNAALDVSASGVMSMEQAVTQLNATYSGNLGLLGRQYSDLKALTAEELASGKAVEILGDKFKGMNAEVTAATGSYQQMKNAQGDFNEALGKITKPTSDLWNNFWKGWYERGISAFNKLNDNIDAQTIGKKVAEQFKEQLSKFESGDIGGKLDYTKSALTSLTDTELTTLKNYYDSKHKLTQDEELVNKRINAEIQGREELSRVMKKEQEEAAKLQAAKQETADKDNEALKFMNENQAALDKQLEQIRLEAELKGEEADEQDILNAYMQSYIDLVTGSDLVTENNPFAKKRLKELQDYAAGIKTVDTEYEEFIKTIKDFLTDGEDDNLLSSSIQATIDQLVAEQEQLDENSEAWQERANKIAELQALETAVIKKEQAEQKEDIDENTKSVEDYINEIQGYISQFSGIVDDIADAATTVNERNSEAELTNISKQYTDGLISYEEYCNKKAEISKKAARQEYQTQMWQWHASLLTATANIAQGISKAIAEGGVAGIVSGALVAARGAAQIASIMANKPQAPAFANGGIVGGNSYTGDHITSRLNSGEMVLNASQQAQLWKAANGNSGGTNLNVQVVNNRGSDTAVNTQLTASGLRVTIDRVVNSSMAAGKYNGSMAVADNNKNGVTLL